MLGLQGWQRLLHSRPGRRFRERYQRHAADSPARRRWSAAGAVGVILLGLILMPFPGPGTLIVIVGLALLAGISGRVAGLLDAAELRLRRAGQWLQGRWRQAPRAVSALVAVIVLVTVGVLALLAYALLAG